MSLPRAIRLACTVAGCELCWRWEGPPYQRTPRTSCSRPCRSGFDAGLTAADSVTGIVAQAGRRAGPLLWQPLEHPEQRVHRSWGSPSVAPAPSIFEGSPDDSITFTSAGRDDWCSCSTRTWAALGRSCTRVVSSPVWTRTGTSRSSRTLGGPSTCALSSAASDRAALQRTSQRRRHRRRAGTATARSAPPRVPEPAGVITHQVHAGVQRPFTLGGHRRQERLTRTVLSGRVQSGDVCHGDLVLVRSVRRGIRLPAPIAGFTRSLRSGTSPPRRVARRGRRDRHPGLVQLGRVPLVEAPPDGRGGFTNR